MGCVCTADFFYMELLDIDIDPFCLFFLGGGGDKIDELLDFCESASYWIAMSCLQFIDRQTSYSIINNNLCKMSS
jgi:hypothetical protein